MITEQFGIAHVGLHHVHGLVPRHVPHLEHGSTTAGRAGQEAGAQGILTTSVVAQTARNRNREVRVQHNNLLSRNAVSLNPANQIKASHCHFHHGEADPDPQVRLYMTRDCKEHEEAE